VRGEQAIAGAPLIVSPVEPTRCRTSVTNWLARATRCHLSTAVRDARRTKGVTVLWWSMNRSILLKTDVSAWADVTRPVNGAGPCWPTAAKAAGFPTGKTWLVGERTVNDAVVFMDDLRSRLRNRVQLTTDGHKPYLTAVENAFGSDVDYAMLHKIYGAAGGEGDNRRYSPAICTGIDKRPQPPEPVLASSRSPWPPSSSGIRIARPSTSGNGSGSPTDREKRSSSTSSSPASSSQGTPVCHEHPCLRRLP
jgi:hypothetical protein